MGALCLLQLLFGPLRVDARESAPPAPTSQDRPARAVHGTVLDEATGTGIPDVRVYFEAFGEVLGETRTDAEGGFRLEPSDPPRRRLEVDPPQGWSMTVARVRLTPTQRSGEEAIEVALRRSVERPLEGRLLDRTTGRPVPHFWIELRPAEGESEVVQSDADGLFRSRHEYPRGPIVLDVAASRGRRLLGQRPLVVAHLDPLGPGLVEWELDPGPRFEFALDPSLREDDELELRATWIESSGRPAAEGLDAWVAVDSPQSSEVVVEGGRAWVRLNPRSLGARPPRGIRVYRTDLLECADFEFGRGGVRSATALDARPFDVRLEAFALMSGRLEGRERAPVAGALVQWEEIPTGNALEAARTFGRGIVTDAEGRFVVPFLPPGLYAWRFSAEHHEPAQVELPLPAGVESTVNFRLTPIPLAGSIEGTLRSRTGTYGPNLRIHARHLRSKHPSRFTPVIWGGPAGDRVGTFRFENLPEGPWELSCNAIHGFEVTPKIQIQSAPAVGVEFEILDDVPSARLTIELTDAVDGSPCAGPHQLREITARGAQARSYHRGSRIELGRRPLGAELIFALESSGFAPARVRIEDFVEDSDTNSDPASNPFPRRTARLELLRGWATTFHVATADGRDAEGARIFLDERDVGVCDSKGELNVHWPDAASPPTRFLIRYRGLEHAPPEGYRAAELPPPLNHDPTRTEVRLRPRD